MISIGASDRTDTIQAAGEAARMALDRLGPGESIGWALAFVGGRHDPAEMLHALQARLGEVPIVGGAAVGTITHQAIGYSGYECALAAFPSSLPAPTIVVESHLDEDEQEAGRRLGEKLCEAASEEGTALLFYDSIRSGPPPVLNVGSRLLEGIYAGLAGKSVTLIGAGTVSDFQLTQSFVYDGSQPIKHAVVAVVLPQALRAHTAIMHGCIPVSSFMEITRVEGAVVYELDGQPALDVLHRMLGEGEHDWQTDNLSLNVTLGQKHGDLFAPYDEECYVNRLIIAANAEDASLTLFEADFEVGSKVQIMSRDNQLMLDSVKAQTSRLVDSLGGEKPVFALYIDCAGRSSAFCGASVEEASVLQDALPADLPLVGFYSGVEIAPLVGQSRPLDWTGVLTLFTGGGAG
ncbi:MAG: FIST N-terminal domain-containing protein [Chloroflexota bacterium]